MIPKDLMKQDMLALPFVNWDRFVPAASGKSLDLYGWIKRKDSHEDFVLIEYTNTHQDKWTTKFSTSSAEYSDKIHALLEMDEGGHADCIRVEDHFQVDNMVKLK